MSKLPPGFAALVLTHRRPENVVTYETLRKSGYSGPIFLLVDTTDETLPRYRERYGEELVVFDRKELAGTFDTGDNFGLRGITYARNAAFKVAKRLGLRYFVQLDDDYTGFQYRFDGEHVYNPKSAKNLDTIFAALVDFFRVSRAETVAVAQGGDFIGGDAGSFASHVQLRRKAMNLFICSPARPFSFIGRMNEDVTTYTRLGSVGKLFFTTNQVNLNQIRTQANPGGVTDLYLDFGTYVKSFYSVVFSPSSVRIGVLRDRLAPRIHHKVSWRHTTPKILRESVRKGKKPAPRVR